MAQNEFAVLLEMIAIAQHGGRTVDERVQGSLALDERHRAKVMTVEVKQVESVERHALGSPGRESVLQRGESGRIGGALDDHLAVDDGVPDRKIRQCCGNALAEFRGPVEAAAGQKLDLSGSDVRLEPVAVELDFMQPARA